MSKGTETQIPLVGILESRQSRRLISVAYSTRHEVLNAWEVEAAIAFAYEHPPPPRAHFLHIWASMLQVSSLEPTKTPVRMTKFSLALLLLLWKG